MMMRYRRAALNRASTRQHHINEDIFDVSYIYGNTVYVDHTDAYDDTM